MKHCARYTLRLMLCTAVAAIPWQQGVSAADTPRKKQDRASVATRKAAPPPASTPGARAKRLSDAADEIGRQFGVRIVVDAAVPVHAAAPIVPKGVALEVALRALFVGNELMLHYGTDELSGADRLKAVWVFPRAQRAVLRATVAAPSGPAATCRNNPMPGLESYDPQERAASLHRLSNEPVADTQSSLARALDDSDEDVRLQALQASLASTSAPPLDTLRRLVEQDPSEAVRTAALEAYMSHPDASDDEIRTLLDRVADSTQGMLAELARSLREARSAPNDPPLPTDPAGDPQ